MSSFAGSITALFVAGMVGGYAGLCLLGPTDEGQQTAALASARIPDPPALPCSMQAWPNADRKCLDWTAPRAEAAEAKTDGAQKVSANVPPPDKRPATALQPSTVTQPAATVTQPAATFTQPSTVGMTTRQMPAAAPQPVVEAARDAAVEPASQAEPSTPAATKTPASKSRTASHSRNKALAVVRGFGDNLNDVPLNAYAYDGAPRRSVSRPSSVQDRTYYSSKQPRGWWW
jgi:hypothetical protein